jgi:hypothetical protein
MYILGGADWGDDVVNGRGYLGLHVYSMESNQWSTPTLTGDNPFPRSGHCSAVVGAKTIVVFGGKKNSQVWASVF